MNRLLRGLLASLLAIGLIALGTGSTNLAAQDKKDPKKDDKAAKDELRDRSVGIRHQRRPQLEWLLVPG